MKSPIGTGQSEIDLSSAPVAQDRDPHQIRIGQGGDDEIKRIEAALRRLDHGRFGLCIYCGDQISVKRLDLDPTIDSCAICDEG
ncbi:MAG: hypothetical protein VX593_08685 [Pseudomonadota bacterium]|nr:hypothetical protein [Pseudomonadota bacterium]